MPKLLRKFLLILGFVLIYFFGVRNVRVTLIDFIQNPVNNLIENNQNLDLIRNPTTIDFISNYSESTSNKYTFKFPFGMFFLFSIIGLIITDATTNKYLILIFIHFIGGLLSIIFLFFGVTNWGYFLIVPDIISRYLLPMFSLGLVALSLPRKKNRLIIEG